MRICQCLAVVLGPHGCVRRDEAPSAEKMFSICEEVGVVKRVHLLSGEVRRLATALKVVEEVQEEVQEVKDEWEDEEVEGNGGLKVAGIRSLHVWT